MVSNYLSVLGLFNHNVRRYLIASALLGFGYIGINTVLFNLYLLRLGYGPEFVGLVNGAGLLTVAVLSLPVGTLGKRWGSRRMMVAGMALAAVGMVLLLQVEVIPATWQVRWLVATMMLSWVGGTLFSVNGAPFLMGATDLGNRSHAFSVQAALFPLSGFFGNLIGGMLPGFFATALGLSLDHPAPYRYSLWLVPLSYFIASVVLRTTHEVRPGMVQETADEASPIPLGLITIMATVMLFLLACSTAASTFLNVYLDTGLQVATAQIGALMAFGRLLSIPAALAAPLLMARWGKGRTVIVGISGMVFSLLPLALIPHWAAAGFGFMCIMATSSAAGTPLTVYQQESVSPGWRSTMSGAVNTASGLGQSAIAFGGGYIIGALGYRSLFLTAAGLGFASVLIFWAYFRARGGEIAAEPSPTVT